MPATLLNDVKTPKYSVKQAAELSGLSLNQVRLWERRYSLVCPQRANNGYRLYTREDIEVLRYAQQETQKGLNIQVIAEQIRFRRPEIIAASSQQQVSIAAKLYQSPPRYPATFEQMIEAISHGDPLRFNLLLVQAQAGYTFSEALQNVDLPVLAKIGAMTVDGSINIAASHLAAGVIRRRISSHVQNLGIPKNSAPVILGCAPNDYHELGLMCCHLELTEHLIPTLYLGTNLPLTELLGYCHKLKPRGILFSVIAPLSDETAHQIGNTLAHSSFEWPIALGGFEAEKRFELFQSYGLEVMHHVSQVLSWSALRQGEESAHL